MTLLLTDVMNRTDIGMIQRRSGFCLTLEAAEGLRVLATSSGKNLRATKRCNRVSSALYTHAATAQRLDDAVMGNDLANHCGGPLSMGGAW
jgi:hypothetical protein